MHVPQPALSLGFADAGLSKRSRRFGFDARHADATGHATRGAGDFPRISSPLFFFFCSSLFLGVPWLSSACFFAVFLLGSSSSSQGETSEGVGGFKRPGAGNELEALNLRLAGLSCPVP